MSRKICLLKFNFEVNEVDIILRRDIVQESTVYRSIQKEVQEERDREIAINLLRSGVAIDIIAPVTGLSIEEVQQLQQQLNNSPQN